jgi:type IX secretion system PorP/SprF family membrane protein
MPFNNLISEKMKKIAYISILLMLTGTLSAQQFPLMEGYNTNPFTLSPAYAGIHNSKTVFIDYRSDWSGIDGGPKTYQLSYNDKLNEKVGLGGRFIYDKTDIFKQTLILGTYTYEVKLAEEHILNFGLSAGFFRNSIDLAKYYNNPDYVQDPVLLYGQEKSKIKFATDISALYRYKDVEAGILFSNVMFGTVKYHSVDMTYKPLKNYLLHASYLFAIDERWTVRPTVILRGGQDIPVQFELAPSVTWNNRIWGTAVYRTGGIFGMGFGGEVYNGILLNYSYNLSSNVSPNTFGSHQLSLGVKIFNFINNEKKKG